MWAKFAIIECAIGKGKKPNSANALTDEEIDWGILLFKSLGINL